jgi:hypothetical protein
MSNTICYDIEEVSARQVILPFVPATQHHLRVITDDSEVVLSFDGYTRSREDCTEPFLSRWHLNGQTVTERELDDRYPGLVERAENWLVEDVQEAHEERLYRWALSEILDNE